MRAGLPVIDIVGLPGSAVKEARERMKVAIKNSKIEFPQSRILINLSPADLRKDGSSFDLPIALSVLIARLNRGASELNEVKIMVMGELELSGDVRPVRGVLGAVATGVQHGIKYFVVPKENEKEASILKNIKVFGVSCLGEAFEVVDNIELSYYRRKATLKKTKKKMSMMIMLKLYGQMRKTICNMIQALMKKVFKILRVKII